MKEEKKKPEETSRRSFLNKGVLAGALALLGFNSTYATPQEDEKKVKLLTADGKLVEVPKKNLPKKSGKVVSNKDLLKWVENNKK
jgi:hypothetical protein